VLPGFGLNLFSTSNAAARARKLCSALWKDGQAAFGFLRGILFFYFYKQVAGPTLSTIYKGPEVHEIATGWLYLLNLQGASAADYIKVLVESTRFHFGRRGAFDGLG